MGGWTYRSISVVGLFGGFPVTFERSLLFELPQGACLRTLPVDVEGSEMSPWYSISFLKLHYKWLPLQESPPPAPFA